MQLLRRRFGRRIPLNILFIPFPVRHRSRHKIRMPGHRITSAPLHPCQCLGRNVCNRCAPAPWMHRRTVLARFLIGDCKDLTVERNAALVAGSQIQRGKINVSVYPTFLIGLHFHLIRQIAALCPHKPAGAESALRVFFRNLKRHFPFRFASQQPQKHFFFQILCKPLRILPDAGGIIFSRPFRVDHTRDLLQIDMRKRKSHTSPLLDIEHRSVVCLACKINVMLLLQLLLLPVHLLHHKINLNLKLFEPFNPRPVCLRFKDA